VKAKTMPAIRPSPRQSHNGFNGLHGIETARRAAAAGQGFRRRLRAVLNDAAVAAMLDLGRRRGFLARMAGAEAVTPPDLAAACGVAAPLAREWLGALATAGILDLDGKHGTYSLPRAHAEGLLGGSECGAALVSLLLALNRPDAGAAPRARLRLCGARMQDLLALMPRARAALKRGGSACVVATGPKGFPARLSARFPRARIAVQPRTGVLVPDGFDFIAIEDALGDEDDAALLSRVARALHPGGFVLALGPALADHAADDLDRPSAPFLHAVFALLHDAPGGEARPRALGEDSTLALLRAAGLDRARCERIPDDDLRHYYVAERPAA
jgi:hypothetical protein